MDAPGLLEDHDVPRPEPPGEVVDEGDGALPVHEADEVLALGEPPNEPVAIEGEEEDRETSRHHPGNPPPRGDPEEEECGGGEKDGEGEGHEPAEGEEVVVVDP